MTLKDTAFSEENQIPLSSFTLKARQIGIDTKKHLVVYMRGNCPTCRSEGFRSESRVKVILGKHWMIATLNVITSDILNVDEIGLSESAWTKLNANDGDEVIVIHAESLESFDFVRAKLYGKPLNDTNLKNIMLDMTKGFYSDIQLSSFITACVDLSAEETIALTKAMSESGRKLMWQHEHIVDKHCVGGLPGNRTSMLIVPIIAAYGLMIPKTSSRAITSPAGTADTMEMLAPVNLSIDAMRKVVEKEGGCIVWGGSVDLSPVDDILVQVERALDLDSSKQLVASVLSKKIAAGSTQVLIDMPVGPTAKIRSKSDAHMLASLFLNVGKAMNLNLHIEMTNGHQPIGRGIGPVLEARDILSVLRCEKDAPQDLRERGIFLASKIIEHYCPHPPEDARLVVEEILNTGRALQKFEAICEAQGGMSELKYAKFKSVVIAGNDGIVESINNRLIAKIAKLAGAPDAPEAGVDFHTPLETRVEKGQPLFTIYATSQRELDHSLHYYHTHSDTILIGEDEL